VFPASFNKIYKKKMTLGTNRITRIQTHAVVFPALPGTELSSCFLRCTYFTLAAEKEDYDGGFFFLEFPHKILCVYGQIHQNARV
jgi:hypothetical protein